MSYLPSTAPKREISNGAVAHPRLRSQCNLDWAHLASLLARTRHQHILASFQSVLDQMR